jgi:drug/metabolite transporter (DMT)-like permease
LGRYRRAGGSSVGNSSLVNFLIAVAIDALLATLVFRHAYRRGNRNATAWGVVAFLAAVIAIPLYFLSYWYGKSRRSR